MPRSSKKTKMYTLIGGKVNKEDKDIYEAIIRECKEELNVDINKEEFKLILEFTERAGSDPNLIINMHMFMTNHKIDELPLPNEEVLEYKWFTIGDNEDELCDSIKFHLLPFLKEHNI
jgi:8-oxo-dGTP pyrophosphatase MutT (NUDIX family)